MIPMPSYMPKRPDAAQLWAAFQAYRPGHPGASHLRAFIAGWDAAQAQSETGYWCEACQIRHGTRPASEYTR
jgi:hypothetical protein